MGMCIRDGVGVPVFGLIYKYQGVGVVPLNCD